MEKVYCVISSYKNSSVAILISDKINFKTKYVTRGREKHFITIKRSVHKDTITNI